MTFVATAARRRALRNVLVACALALAPPAGAEDARVEVVHEYFTYPGGDLDDPAPGLPRLPAPGAADPSLEPPEPAARYGAGGVDLGDGDWEAPEHNGAFSPAEPALLDAYTGPEGRLRYAEVFEPSVAPWKRSVARDLVVRRGDSAGLVVSDAVLTPHDQRAASAPTDRVFTGRLTASFRSGFPMPLPSVAPDMVILDVRTEPPVTIRFARDAADNHFAIADWDGPVAVTFRAAAPGFYFDGVPPPDATPVQMPPAGTAEAEVLDAIGVRSGTRRDDAVAALVSWFGSFEAGALPASRSDELYRDISLSRRGVCRHRAIAFAITALSLGIPTRYVHNEAHAFVEVRHGDAGWRRYDLGGEAAGLDVVGVSGERTPEAPEGESPYEERVVPSQHAAPSGRPEDRGASADVDGTRDAAALDADARRQPGLDPSGAARPRTFGDLPQPGDDAPREPGAVVRLGTRLEWSDVPAAGWAGDPLSVTGRLVDADGGAVGGAEISVWLGPADPARLDAPVQRLGQLRTAEDGTFSGAIDLPAETPVGDWGVFAVYSGDVALEPTRSQ